MSGQQSVVCHKNTKICSEAQCFKSGSRFTAERGTPLLLNPDPIQIRIQTKVFHDIEKILYNKSITRNPTKKIQAPEEASSPT
jgi:hypothetical protein